MSEFRKFNSSKKDFVDGVHDLCNDEFGIALVYYKSAPKPTDVVLSDLTEINYSNIFPYSRILSTRCRKEKDGTLKLILLRDLDFICRWGETNPFRWVAIYNATTEDKRLVGYSDMREEIVLDGDATFTFTVASEDRCILKILP